MLLGDRMAFPNLDLLIVYEDHLFEAYQKEKPRTIYKHVDTLFSYPDSAYAAIVIEWVS